MMMLSWIPSNLKMHAKCAIVTYAALAMVAILLITPAMSAPLPSAATEQVSPPSSAQPSSPKSSKKKGNVAPPATDETVKVSKTGDSSIYCINNSMPNESITLEDLKRMINTVDQVFGSLETHETYLTTDYGASVFHSQDAIQAYYRLFDMLESSHLPTPRNIWMSRSPCLLCAKRLIYEYGKPDSIKPTLQIASMYAGENLLDAVESLKCMARMVHLNFTIQPWDWRDVRNNTDHTDCVDSIDSALLHTGFNEKREIVQSLVNFIHELSFNPEVNSWCS